jgi:hypothetical protein
MEPATKRYGWIVQDSSWKRIHISEYSKVDGQVRDDLGRLLVARQGSKMIWHFAFHPGQVIVDCDRRGYKDGKTSWHEVWQSYSPASHVEVYRWKAIESTTICHIADLVDREGYVVEFQHSTITLEDIQSREQVYDRMCWLIDATNAEWIPLEDKVLIKQRHSWWSHLTKPIIFDIGVGLAYIERNYFLTIEKSEGQYKQTHYYLCQFGSYDHFIRSRFVLKEGIDLHPSHQVSIKNKRTYLQTFDYRITNSEDSVSVECTSRRTYEYRALLRKFGLIWDPQRRQHQMTLYNTKELSDLAVKYKREELKCTVLLARCKSLLGKIRQCSESNDVVIATDSPVLPGIQVKLHPETIERYRELYKEASAYQTVLEASEKEVISFSHEGLLKLALQRIKTYQPIYSILVMMDRQGWSIEEEVRKRENLTRNE